MHERRFNREIERLRDPERIARLEVPRVVDLALAGLLNPSTVLDVGCGTGLFAEEFAARSLQVTGLDVNPEMLAPAREFVPTGVFQEGLAEKIPCPDTAFDLVFMGLLLHETDDPLAALKEARRVTRQRVAILEWPDEDQPIGPPRGHRLAAEKINELARQVGFIKVGWTKLNNLVLYNLE